MSGSWCGGDNKCDGKWWCDVMVVENVKYEGAKRGVISEKCITHKCKPADLWMLIWGRVRRSALRLKIWLSIEKCVLQIEKVCLENADLRTYGPRDSRKRLMRSMQLCIRFCENDEVLKRWKRYNLGNEKWQVYFGECGVANLWTWRLKKFNGWYVALHPHFWKND
jgi:hypothetical protein